MTPNLTITRCKFGSNFEVFWNFFKKPLKVPSLARSVPKPLKVPSLARSVPKPLNEPSLARSVLKSFKMEEEGEGEGAKRHFSLCHETLLLFAADLLLP